ncbi:MAG: hypothetical protein HY736_06370 [Verrucomicrobia bacterium]|nr:hypothetical protein [Verrucomicrobiota bacterium]
MSRLLTLLWQGVGACTRSILAFAVWTLWLALAILLVFQLYIASTNELAVPDFALRQLENRFAASGFRVKFSRTAFDPTGRVLIENAQVLLPAFAEPVLTARAIFVRLNPWSLAVGKFEPDEIRIFDATATVPAMLSPSGRAEEIVRDLDGTITPGDRVFSIPHLSGRVAGIAFSARGSVQLRGARGPASDAIADFIANRFPTLCRQVLAVTEQLAAFEQPALHLELSPSESGATIVNVTLLARSAKLGPPVSAEARNIRAVTRVLLFGDAPASQLEFAADDVRLPFGTTAHGVRAFVAGRMRPGAGFHFEPREFDVTAESVATAGFSARAVSAQLFPRPLPRLDASIVAQVMGAPLAVRAEADFAAQSAVLHFEGAVSPGLLDPLSRRLGADVRRYFDFAALYCDNGVVHLGPGWKFENVAARIGVRQIKAYGVAIDEGAAAVEFDGRRFGSPEAFARIGENFARGSYEHDLQTHQYRFLLTGRLRPLEISGWFRAWWPNFFQQFGFPAAPPAASVDVSGFWRDGRRSAVFVFADVPRPVIRGVAFGQVRARLFIRPGFYDGLEVSATGGSGAARGTFTYTADPATFDWRRLDLKLDSTMDVGIAAQLIGPLGAAVLAPFKLAAPPALKLHGRFDGPAAPGGRQQSLQVDARTSGEIRFHDFPLRDASFRVKLQDDEIVIEEVEARFASGVAGGRARVWGRGDKRRLGFDFSLKEANLGEAAGVLQEFLAHKRGQPPAPPGKFVRRNANVQLDVAASAEGRYGDPYTYHGEGSASLRGPEIGEVPLLGLLSELITFTTLRFTEARGNFKIEGPKLVFPEVALRGANSAIDGHGDYTLANHGLDFRAKIFPFQESGNLFKSVVGAVLTPLSNALEVKLTGTLEKPEWTFVIGPTNFLRSLATGSAESTEKSDAPAQPKADSPPPPVGLPPTPPRP